MIPQELQPKIEDLAKPFLEEAAVELFELIIRRQGRMLIVEFIVDKPQGGISIGQCSWLNSRLVDTIEAQGLIPEDYAVEVNSPGLDRLLKTKKDFARVLGRTVHFHLNAPVEGKFEHQGKIKNIDEEGVVLTTPKQMDIKISLTNIIKAIQVI